MSRGSESPARLDEAALAARLAEFVEPNLRQTLAEARALRACRLEADGAVPRLRVELELGIPTGISAGASA